MKEQECIIALQSCTQYQEPVKEFLHASDDFVENGYLRSKSFHFWGSFLNDILLILLDLTRSHREED